MRQNEHNVDGRWSGPSGTVLLEVRKTNSARDVRDGLVGLAFALQDESPRAEAVCVVVSEKLSERRVQQELDRFRSIAHPTIAPRVHYLVSDSDGIHGEYSATDSFYDYVSEVVHKETKQGVRNALPARQAVVSALVTDLITHRSAPQPLTFWQKAAGVSYPTAMAAVSDLTRKGLIEDSPERGVRLRPLSAAEVLELARDHASKRQVLLYRDPTGFSTSTKLLKRFNALREAGRIDGSLRVGGVIGAAHYFPQLDITSAARLDLSTNGAVFDVAQLDAALVEVTDSEPRSAAVLAVHYTADVLVNLSRAFAQPDQWASAFECLADLVELGYLREAHEMAVSMINAPAAERPAARGRRNLT